MKKCPKCGSERTSSTLGESHFECFECGYKYKQVLFENENKKTDS